MDNTPEGGNEILGVGVRLVSMWPLTVAVVSTAYMSWCIALAIPYFPYPTQEENPDE